MIGTVLLQLLRTASDIEARLDRAVEHASGLTLPQLWFLHHLADGGGALPLGRVAERLSCAKSNVTQLADRLESQGLLRREPDPDDRRSVLATITDAGRERYAMGAEAHARAANDIVAGLVPEDREQLGRLLDALREPAATA